MTERDTDIEFDFFEEPETTEAARPERPPGTRPRGPRPPIRTPQGVTPLLRLVGLIAFAIVIVLLLVYALQYRYSGIVGISDSLRQAVARKNLAAAQAGALLVTPAERLVASDVVWDDSFRDPSKQVLADQGVGDVRVPSSAFVQNPDFYTANGLAAVVTRLRGV